MRHLYGPILGVGPFAKRGGRVGWLKFGRNPKPSNLSPLDSKLYGLESHKPEAFNPSGSEAVEEILPVLQLLVALPHLSLWLRFVLRSTGLWV